MFSGRRTQRVYTEEIVAGVEVERDVIPAFNCMGGKDSRQAQSQ